MLEPEKYMDLDKCILSITSLIIRYMIKTKIAKLNDVLSHVEEELNDSISERFLTALTILYAFNKIEYLEHNDNLSLVDYNEVK